MSEVDFDVIGEQIMYELNRRLGTPELAQDLPGTLLMKVAMDYVRHLEKRNQIEQAKLDQVKLDPLEMIDQEGLATDVRIGILIEWRDEVGDYLNTAIDRLDQLVEQYKEEIGYVEPEVVPEVQEVVSDEDEV